MPFSLPWSWLVYGKQSLGRAEKIRSKDQVWTLRVKERLGRPAHQMKAKIVSFQTLVYLS